MQMYNMDTTTLVERCQLAIGSGTTLTWLGISAEGLLAASDSTGFIRIRSEAAVFVNIYYN